MGFALIEEERHARRFLEWLWSQGDTGAAFTTAQVLTWAKGDGSLKDSYQCQRLAAVRGLARYCHAIGIQVQVPAVNALRPTRDRRRPHTYPQEELDALIGACRPAFAHVLVQTTMANIIALMARTGMRIGEALRLRPQDINPEEATVLVRANKHGPDRLIPIHPSRIEALTKYETHPYRRATRPHPEATLFVTTRGRAYQRMTVDSYFQRIRETAEFTWQGPAPRLHDLRHTFATRQMIRAYSTEGVDPASTLSLVAIWLGHSDPSHTYWYVQAVPELLALAAHRIDLTTTME